MVSVWMITYNHEKYIAEAIENILNQKTNFRFDLIIGEDESTDGTARIVEGYAAAFPDIIRARFNKPNIGIMPNMLKTLQECTGKYIALCEGDDYWTDPLKLQKQVDFLENNFEYSLCYHNAKIVDQNNELVSESKLPTAFQRDFSSKELMRGAWVLTLTILFRNVIKAYPPEMMSVLSGDTFLTILLGQHGNGKYLKEIEPAVYRQHPGGAWSGLDEQNQIFGSLNSLLYMYQYVLRTEGKEFSIQFLFDVVYPRLRELSPEANPWQLEIRRLRQELQDISNSRTYRAAKFLLRPIDELLKLSQKA